MRAKLQSIVDALPTLVAYIDVDQRYQFVNAAYERWFGRPRAEIIGDPIVVRIDGTHPETVVLEVHNGGAIPESLRPSIFDPFRGTRHRRERSRGLGLGLFITQQLVQAHGGTIELRSTSAEGTTFAIRLPRRSARTSGA